MPDIFRSNDGTVVKIVHDDGAESAVKTVLSVDGRVDGDGIAYRAEDRHKFSLFLSSSVGCFMGCRFCHLTLKGATYRPLSGDEVFADACQAVSIAAERDPSLPGRFAKICWMGMGEDAVRRPAQTRRLTVELADWLLTSGWCAGIDGVDLSTVLPRTSADWVTEFAALDDTLDAYPANPATAGRAAGRSRFRLFYSLHSAVQPTREQLIPHAAPVDVALDAVARFHDGGRRSVIIHHLLFDGVNDTDHELLAVLAALARHGLSGCELRLLRYNGCGLSQLGESRRFEQAARILAAGAPVKVQTSLGAEQKAACGQFIVRSFDPASEIAGVAAASAGIVGRR